MKSKQAHFTAQDSLETKLNPLKALHPQLVTVFGSSEIFADAVQVKRVCEHFADAVVIGCSTAGEISDEGVHDGHLVVTAVRFDTKVTLVPVTETVKNHADSFASGQRFTQKLRPEGLKALFFFGRSLGNNADEIVNGLNSVASHDAIISGGMAADGVKFLNTFTVLNGVVANDALVGVGVYGDELDISYGSLSGWIPFGPVRRVTRAVGNIIYEIDNEPALDLYKRYLGEDAKHLPVAGQRYPIALLHSYEDKIGVIRGMLGVDEVEKTLCFGGDIPNDSLIRLMQANNNSLIEGAKGAAELTVKNRTKTGGLAILVSCVARKMVMGQDVDDEIDAVRDVLGKITLAGYYAYGEICPQEGQQGSKWHNQTMTITYITEKSDKVAA